MLKTPISVTFEAVHHVHCLHTFLEVNQSSFLRFCENFELPDQGQFPSGHDNSVMFVDVMSTLHEATYARA